MKPRLIPLRGDDLCKLLQEVPFGAEVRCRFGTGGAALEAPESEDDPRYEAFRLLERMRGISNRNMDGAGI